MYPLLSKSLKQFSSPRRTGETLVKESMVTQQYGYSGREKKDEKKKESRENGNK